MIENWQEYEKVWEHSYQQLRISSTDYALLLTDSAWSRTEDVEKIIELAFEKFNVPGFYLAKEPVLSA